MNKIERISIRGAQRIEERLQSDLLKLGFASELASTFADNIAGFLERETRSRWEEYEGFYLVSRKDRVSIAIPLERSLAFFRDHASLSFYEEGVAIQGKQFEINVDSIIECERREEGDKYEKLVFKTDKGGEVAFVREKESGEVTVSVSA